jgi:AhpD family alkylhydroperoxidase
MPVWKVGIVIIAAAAMVHAADPIVSLETLQQRSRARVAAVARVPLAPEKSEAFQGLKSLEGGDRIPNYLRVSTPEAARAMADLMRTLLYSGAIAPETKLAMGLRVAQIHGSAYAGAHFQRMLEGTEAGRSLIGKLDMPADESAALALRYAEWLTRDIHGVTDENFRSIRTRFTDPQIVELTLAVCFFNYFNRYTEALSLPVEDWVLRGAFVSLQQTFAPPVARVGLISNEQLSWAASVNPGRGPGPNVVNSMRAMNLSPAIAAAWRRYGTASREGAAVSRDILLQVSFAVSTANGCRYCTLHQVQGLRRLGVSPAKLMQMKKDDSALTPRELVAVTFARKLTRDPISITDADYRALEAEFGAKGALDVLKQTCTFAFMNRFTDNLRLPSEDEAVRIYEEVYGASALRSGDGSHFRR